MARSKRTSTKSRNRSQAQNAQLRQQLRERTRQLRETQRQLRQAQKIAERIQYKEKKSAAVALRKAGLLSKKVVPRINKQNLQGNKTFDKLRRQFADIVTGQSVTRKVRSKSAIARLKAQGIRVSHGRAIVQAPLRSTERVYLTPRGEIRRTDIPPRSIQTLDQWLSTRYARDIVGTSREAQLRSDFAAHPGLFNEIVNISRRRHDAWMYAEMYNGPDWPDDWEVFEDYPELFYYHES